MSSNEEPVTLLTLADGALLELFDRELSHVCENILDPNTDAGTVREINIKIKIKPDESRRMAAVALMVSSKTGPVRGVGTQFFFGKRGGQAVAVEANPAQLTFDQAAKLKAVDFKTGEVKGD